MQPFQHYRNLRPPSQQIGNCVRTFALATDLLWHVENNVPDLNMLPCRMVVVKKQTDRCNGRGEVQQVEKCSNADLSTRQGNDPITRYGLNSPGEAVGVSQTASPISVELFGKSVIAALYFVP